MAYNTILIKRRTTGSAGAPGSLSGGELAFNEVDSTLYYGSNAGVIAIGGSGAFVDRTSAQSISGVKTFEDGITLPDAPVNSTDATNKDYVDTEIDSLSSALQTAIDNLNTNSTTAIEALSTEVYSNFVEKVESEAVTLNGGLTATNGITVDTITTSGAVTVGTDLTVTGNLSVLGTQVVVNTETINISGTSTQIDVVNNGTGTGITVNQTGAQDVAEFKDDGATALIIKDGGNVGVGTATPNEKLTVSGNISASGTIFASGGFEVASGGGSTTLYVENGKVGVNTETPNEELTVSGSISATENIYAVDGNFSGAVDLGSLDVGCFSVDASGNVDTCGTLTVGGATTLNNTLSVTGTATFDSAITASSTLDVTGASTFASTVSAQGALTVDGTSTLNGAVTINNTLDVTGATTFASTVSAQGAVEFDSTLTVDGLMTINNSTTTTGSISGTAYSSYLVDFIIDGGTF